MNISEIIVGDRALVQPSEFVKEIATIKGFTPEGLVIVRLSDGEIKDIHPQYILKSFGQ